MKRYTALTATALALTALSLSACTPANNPKPAVYQASKADVMQAVAEIAWDFRSLPTYQSLYLWSKQSTATQITLTSAERITAQAQGLAVTNANDDREIVFTFTENAGLTSVTYSKAGYVDKQVETVFNALDKRFVRVNLP